MSDERSAGSWLWFVACAALFLGLATSSAWRKSATFDEPVYIIAGLSYLDVGDFTMKDDAPPLVAYLAGLSPLAHGLRIPGGALAFRDSFANEYQFAARLLYGSGVDAESILFWSRMAILVPFGMLLLFAVSAWSRALFGPIAAGVATLLTATCPNLIAHARLVAADVPSAAAMTFACYQLFRLTQDPTTRRAIPVGLAVGLALITKFTSLVLLPVVAVVLALVAWRNKVVRGANLVRLVALIAVPIVVMTTAVHGSWDVTLYWDRVGNVYRNIRRDIDWFYLGELRPGGVWYYYFGALALKGSVPLLLLGLSSLFVLHRRGRGLLAETTLLLPVVVLLVAAAYDAASSGLRRVVFVLPVLAISGSRWAAGISSLRARAVLPIAALLAWHCGSSLWNWPHYIPYFNEIAGGRDNGHHYLDDSNIDWGQDLKALPAVLRRHGIERIYLLYHGQESPDYHRIPWTPVSPQQLARPTPGYYAISLHFLTRWQATPGGWLERFRPFDRAGTSILLFRIPQ